MTSRFDRQILLPQVGEAGQDKIKNSAVTVFGCGGLGSPVLTYLACAGVGSLRIVDFDAVSESNLNRQFIHGEASIGENKVASAARAIKALNSGIHVEPLNVIIDDTSIDELIKGSDVLIDCTDNIATRLIINKGALRFGVPLVEGGINGFIGFVLCVDREHACLSCLGYKQAKSNEAIPVIGATAGVIGTLQAMECLKIILGCGNSLFGTMLHYNGLAGSFDRISVNTNKKCGFHEWHAAK